MQYSEPREIERDEKETYKCNINGVTIAIATVTAMATVEPG